MDGGNTPYLPHVLIRIILASNRGALMEPEITPVITSGIVMQLLAGVNLFDVGFTPKEDTGLFGATQKSQPSDLGSGVCLLLVIQLITTALIVILLDELLQNGYRLTSGIILFIATNICELIMWKVFLPTTASQVGGSGDIGMGLALGSSSGEAMHDAEVPSRRLLNSHLLPYPPVPSIYTRRLYRTSASVIVSANYVKLPVAQPPPSPPPACILTIISHTNHATPRRTAQRARPPRLGRSSHRGLSSEHQRSGFQRHGNTSNPRPMLQSNSTSKAQSWCHHHIIILHSNDGRYWSTMRSEDAMRSHRGAAGMSKGGHLTQTKTRDGRIGRRGHNRDRRRDARELWLECSDPQPRPAFLTHTTTSFLTRSRKVLWTAETVTLLIFLLCSQVPLYGIMSSDSSDLLYWMRVILASNRGMLMELEITSIITSGTVMQLVAVANIIDVDFSLKEDRALFSGAQILLALNISLNQAMVYVLTGLYGQPFDLGDSVCLLFMTQLIAAFIVILVSPPHTLQEAVLDPIHTATYIVFMLSACALFSKTWIEISGSGPWDVARAVEGSTNALSPTNQIVGGHRESLMYKELNRVIPAAATFGGAILGLLSVAAEREF
ncbi:hypothetical protein CVT25_015554 [Psilocybe cyanescens]|uniref:Translocon Sec61/SecY plug domain-containing protein n=1 Tax=Psilocybe cyanescens TaxID=93625 RepID=A0A409X1L9_PSICY|nr:hypothetical protein CVT25_015554 [Psilocybe cyanescens]